MIRIKKILILVLLSNVIVLSACTEPNTSSLNGLPELSAKSEWFELTFRTKLQFNNSKLASCSYGEVLGLQTRFGRGSVFTEFNTEDDTFAKDLNVKYYTYKSNGDLSIKEGYSYPIVRLKDLSFLNFSYNHDDSDIEVRISGEIVHESDYNIKISIPVKYGKCYCKYKDDLISIKVKRRSNNSLIFNYKKSLKEDCRHFLCIYNKYHKLIAYIELKDSSGKFDGYLDYGGSHFSIITLRR